MDYCLDSPLLFAGCCKLQEPGTGVCAQGTATGATPKLYKATKPWKEKTDSFETQAWLLDESELPVLPGTL